MPALPIEQRLRAVPGRLLRDELRAVLIEICGLAENGGRGVCDATNAYLAVRTGALPKSVSAVISKLADRGLVTVDVFKARGNRRAIRPTPACRALYDEHELAEPWPAGGIPTFQKSGEVAGKSGIPGSRDTYPRKSGEGTPGSRDTYPRKSGDLTTSTYVQETSIDDQERAALRAALTAAEKKVAELEAELAALKAVAAQRELPPPVAPAPHGPAAEPASAVPKPKRSRVAPAAAFDPLTLLTDDHSPAFRAAWADFVASAKQRGKESSAFALMLKKLAAYPETFAVAQLEAAKMGNWSGVVFTDTPRRFAEWQAAQGGVRNPGPAAASVSQIQQRATGANAATERLMAQAAARLAAAEQTPAGADSFTLYAPIQ